TIGHFTCPEAMCWAHRNAASRLDLPHVCPFWILRKRLRTYIRHGAATDGRACRPCTTKAAAKPHGPVESGAADICVARRSVGRRPFVESSAHHLLRLTFFSSPSSEASEASAFSFPEST